MAPSNDKSRKSKDKLPEGQSEDGPDAGVEPAESSPDDAGGDPVAGAAPIAPEPSEDAEAPEFTEEPEILEGEILAVDEADLVADAPAEHVDAAEQDHDGPADAEALGASEPEPEPEPEPAMREASEPQKQPASASIVPLLIGGALAALIGFAVARYLETSQPPEGPTTTELAAALAAEEARATELAARLSTLEGADVQPAIDAAAAPLSDRIDALDARISDLDTGLAALSERVETIALRPTATGIEPEEFDAALNQFRGELNAAIETAQTEISNARSEAEQISETAFAAETAAIARTAWGQVANAVESGVGYADALAEAEGVFEGEIPQVITANAVDGVPSLASLQEAFPEAARAALESAIRSDAGDTTMDRLTAFLRVQTGARSLSPREGGDPDAVLSRVEAALRQGDLSQALSEADALPESGQAALAPWREAAVTRLEALAAVETIAAELDSN
ncbi:MAG: hypothetical protein AAF771_08200 [Pseudomonadota bacterium]